MHTPKLKTTVESELTIGDKPLMEVLNNIVSSAHDAFLYSSRLRQEYNLNESAMDDLEGLEGCLCEILDILGD